MRQAQVLRQGLHLRRDENGLGPVVVRADEQRAAEDARAAAEVAEGELQRELHGADAHQGAEGLRRVRSQVREGFFSFL